MIDNEFLPWLEKRSSHRPSLPLEQLLAESGGGGRCAILVVDMVEGFCRQGPLASESVGNLIQPIRDFLDRAYRAGVEKFFFPCDSHPPDSAEFQAFPPHCIRGTTQAELVKELTTLDFADSFVRLDKGSVSSLIGTELTSLLIDVDTIVCVGDCTDLCVYHLAVGLRFWANAQGESWRVVVPQDLVATYDLPTTTALQAGALPHPADFLSDVFLYHLELNGVEVFSSLT